MASKALTANVRRVNKSALARELGVSRQAVHDLVQRGILSEDAEGLLDVEMAKIALANRVRPSSKTAQALHSPAPAPSSPSTATQQTAAAAQAPLATDYHTAKTLREVAEARMAQLKVAEMQGQLTDANEVGRAIWTAFRTLRDTAMPLGRRVAGRVAAMQDAREIQLLIDEEVRTVLNTFRQRILAPLATEHASPQTAAAPAEQDQADAPA
jgi:hypothetical protein